MPGIAATGTIKPIAAIANTTRIADMATIATMPGTMPAGVAGMPCARPPPRTGVSRIACGGPANAAEPGNRTRAQSVDFV